MNNNDKIDTAIVNWLAGIKMNNIVIERVANGWIIYSMKENPIQTPTAVFNELTDMLEWLKEKLAKDTKAAE